jgi:predicted small integral membrane protein
MSTKPTVKPRRKHFLPIRTNTFDRVFISVVAYVAIHLLWMRFVEFYLPLWGATLLSLVLAVIIVRRG